MPLEPGQAATVERVVTRELTADALGNPGVTVFATPFVINLLEHAAHAVMVPHLAPGAATVGTGVDVRHLAATPPGMRVRATAILMQTDGHRCLVRPDDPRRGRVRVHPDQPTKLDGEPGLLPGLAERARVHRLAPVHVAAGECPLAVGGMDRPAGEQEAPVLPRNGAGDHLLVHVVDEAAAGAYHLRALVGPDRLPDEARPAEGTEADRVRREVGVGRMGRVGRHDAGQSITRARGALTPGGPAGEALDRRRGPLLKSKWGPPPNLPQDELRRRSRRSNGNCAGEAQAEEEGTRP